MKFRMRFLTMAMVLIPALSAFVPMWQGTAATVDKTTASVADSAADFSRYEVILARKPFGEIMLRPVPPPKLAPNAPPPFVKDLRMCAITDSDFGIRVGFVDIKKKPPKSYYLGIGESEDGITVVNADYEMEAALLRKGSEEYWIYLGGKAGQAPAGLASAGDAAGKKKKRESYAVRLRRRRETFRYRKVEPPQLTGKELEEHLKQYQMDLIRKGMPPLPIPLTRDLDDQLVAEGVLPALE